MKNTNGKSIRIVITEHAPKERRDVKELKYGFYSTIFGRIIVAQDSWGICLLDFVMGSDKESESPKSILTRICSEMIDWRKRRFILS